MNLWGSLKAIYEQQYVLARKCHISPLHSDQMPDFEREIFTNILMKEMQEEKEALGKKGK